MIRKSLIALIYEAASIQRWNDHIRPWAGFTELDKQAHKLFYTYVLSKCEGEGNYDPLLLLEGGIFEFLHRVVLTDIKPPIYHKLMQEKGAQINDWILEELRGQLEPLKGGFYEKMQRYFRDESYAAKEKQILKAAHYFATDWEFSVIYPQNLNTFGIEQVKSEVARGLAACSTFSGFHVFSANPDLKEFLSLIGKLRYQQRWSRAVRMPQTFVMGHMLVVAILAYFCSLEVEACEKRLVNNFFGALFHDLPEVLTRDIVSPVKASVKGLDDIIKEIETEQMQTVIYPLLPEEWKKELGYFTQDEFTSKIVMDGAVRYTTSAEINEQYNQDCYEPIDGEIIRGCDHLSAYMEAYLSLRYGVQSEQIQSGYHNLFEKYENRQIAGIDFGQLFDYFRI
ncbi:MAG: HD domain-containing protein [Ruminococcaceae bacterium]|nr:HD domain-containing protein [Oscillospiraceae bacterium]